MELNLKKNEDGTAILGVCGRLDAVTSNAFEERVLALYDQSGCGLIIDFSALEYISSAGLRALIRGAKKMKSSGGALALCGLCDNVLEVFNISGFATIFEICPGEREAVAAVARQLGK